MRFRRWLIVASCCALMWGSMGRTAHAGLAEKVAILVVSDSSDPQMKAVEAQLKTIVKKLRAQYALDKDMLPVMSYHFNIPSERQFCESRLGVHKDDLIFVGVVRHHNLTVEKVLRRASRVQDPQSSAYQIFLQVAPMLGIRPEDLPIPGHTPTPQVTGTGQPTGTGNRVEFSALEVLNEDGERTHKFKSNENAVFFRVYVRNLAPEVEHTHKLAVGLTDPEGVPYPVTVGGTIDLKPGGTWLGHDVLEDSNKDHTDGFKILNTPLGAKPGTYKVSVYLDERDVHDDEVIIEAGQAVNDQLALAQAFVSTETGVPKTEFTSHDMGAFCFVLLQNLDVGHEHEHVLHVKCVGPDGDLTPVLGGKFIVKKGEDLSHKEFPADVDLQGGNGFLIKDTDLKNHPGAYKFEVILDDKVVKELPFTIKP